MHTQLRLIAAVAAFSFFSQACSGPLTPLQTKNAVLQCEGRTVALQADCFAYIDDVLACTRQKLTFSDSATKKELNVQSFKALPKKDGDDYPIVAEQFGSLMCVETSNKEKFVVARMDNGGNCESCEWHDVYTHDGVLAGTDRDRKKKNKAVADAVSSAYDKKTKRVLSKNELIDFYLQRAKQ